jgi:P27 family predicted phage terminase small subunit
MGKNIGEFHVLSPNKPEKDMENELDLKEIQIKPPAHLDADAASLWKAIIPDIKTLGYLKRVDQPALELYCRYYSLYRQSEQLIEEDGLWLTDKFGDRTKRSPGAVQMDACVKNMRILGHDLGLTFDSGMREIRVDELSGIEEKQQTPLKKVKFGAEV